MLVRLFLFSTYWVAALAAAPRVALERVLTAEEAAHVQQYIHALPQYKSDQQRKQLQLQQKQRLLAIRKELEHVTDLFQLLPLSNDDHYELFTSDVASDSLLPSLKNPCWWPSASSRLSNVSVGLVCLPYFYILGPQKCGTTDLYDRIMAHPDTVSL